MYRPGLIGLGRAAARRLHGEAGLYPALSCRSNEARFDLTRGRRCLDLEFHHGHGVTRVVTALGGWVVGVEALWIAALRPHQDEGPRELGAGLEPVDECAEGRRCYEVLRLERAWSLRHHECWLAGRRLRWESWRQPITDGEPPPAPPPVGGLQAEGLDGPRAWLPGWCRERGERVWLGVLGSGPQARRVTVDASGRWELGGHFRTALSLDWTRREGFETKPGASP